MKLFRSVLLLSAALAACSNPRRVDREAPPGAAVNDREAPPGAAVNDRAPVATPAAVAPAPTPAPPPGVKLATATFAGGCFWCMETAFEGVPGVYSSVSGYAGGQKLNPTYEEVSAGGTGHAESVQVTYDPAKMTYEKLLDIFWHNIDPLSAEGQFCDRGNQYRSAIFYEGEEQHRLADASRKALVDQKRLPGNIVTQIVPFQRFYPAEEYHQDFYKKNPNRYHSYRLGCGRDRRLQELWGVAPAAH